MKSKTEKLDLKILYVEDEEVVRNTIYEMLSRRVKHVIIAEDGIVDSISTEVSSITIGGKFQGEIVASKELIMVLKVLPLS